MLIRAQDKVEIVNLDNIVSIYVHVIKPKDKGIKEEYETEIKYHEGNLNNRWLGKYSSEEKALKVLDMIQDAYENTYSQLSTNGLLITSCKKVFNMPADEEVEI
jgi:hypothetical protein